MQKKKIQKKAKNCQALLKILLKFDLNLETSIISNLNELKFL